MPDQNIKNETEKTNADPKKNSLQEGLKIGCVAGLAEVTTTGQLCWTLKTIAQLKKMGGEMPTFVGKYVQGLPLNFISMIPTTACQVGINSLMPSNWHPVINGFLAGVMAAPLATVTEQAMTLKRGELTQFVRTHGPTKLLTGCIGTAGRDGFFTSAFLGTQLAVKESWLF